MRDLTAKLVASRQVSGIAPTKWVPLLLIGIIPAVLAGCGDQASLPLRLLDLTGRHVDPFAEANAKITVFLFTRFDCPISNRYAPEVRRLCEKFASRGVKFYLVYVDPDQSVETIRQHMKEDDYPCGV